MPSRRAKSPRRVHRYTRSCFGMSGCSLPIAGPYMRHGSQRKSVRALMVSSIRGRLTGAP